MLITSFTVVKSGRNPSAHYPKNGGEKKVFPYNGISLTMEYHEEIKGDKLLIHVMNEPEHFILSERR